MDLAGGVMVQVVMGGDDAVGDEDAGENKCILYLHLLPVVNKRILV